jgi:quercetin dioxygenase-like cupin family protein
MKAGMTATAVVLIVMATCLSTAAALRQNAPASRSRVAFSRTLPPLDGSALNLRIVEVTYPPGGANPSHTHPCPVVGYVLEGALRMRVNDGPEVVYRAGSTFYEATGDRHVVSANASTTEPARFLATFICDREVSSLSTPTAPPKPNGDGR